MTHQALHQKRVVSSAVIHPSIQPTYGFTGSASACSERSGSREGDLCCSSVCWFVWLMLIAIDAGCK
jgi:hypothetical protein